VKPPRLSLSPGLTVVLGISINPLALARLLQLCSPTLPVGAYAYSQGMEQAVATGLVTDRVSAEDWLHGVLTHGLAQLDLPVLCQLYAAWQQQDIAQVERLNADLFANRETKELRLEDRQMGIALARLLVQLGLDEAAAWCQRENTTYATLFSLAAVRWQIERPAMLLGFAWSWLENLVSVAVKLVPLGQTDGQRILTHVSASIPALCTAAMDLAPEDCAGSLPGMAILSCLHETEYTRIFRS